MKYKILLLLIMIFFFLFMNGWFSLKPSRNHDVFMEEAIPIRENDQIVGMNYYITLPNNYFSDGILKTKLLESIYHYKDVHDISSFFVRIQIKNLTMKDYSLKDFYIIYNGEKKYFNHSNIVFTSNHSSVFSFFIDFGEITNQDSFFVIEIQ